jgi:hypothetical protein
MDEKSVKRKGSIVKQLSVMLQNRVGAFSSLLRLLKRENIEVIGISMQDSRDATIVRIILNDPDSATHLFIERGIPYTSCDMVVVGFRNSSEDLLNCMYTLASGEINVDFSYALLAQPEGKSLLAMHLCDYEFGSSLLLHSGYTLYYQEDLSR